LTAPRQVRPGEDAPITVGFTGEDGVETSKTVVYHVPTGAPYGTIYLTASDATYTNMLELQTAIGAPVHSPGQVVDLLNNMRTSGKTYVRVWRAEAAYTVEGRDLPDPPPSLALILARAQPGVMNQINLRGSKLTEIEIPAGGYVVTGSKTIQLEVKE
jgi:hypothetical protein